MTAVEWLVEQLNSKYGNDDFIITYINEIEQAKEMEKQQIIDAHLIGLIRSLEMEATKQATEYFDETYGSKGNDEIKGIGSKDINGDEMIFDQELFNYFSQEFNISLLGTEMQDIIDIVKKHESSQTEISDEEIEKSNPFRIDGGAYNSSAAYQWLKGAKWYREQLKKK